MRNKPDRVILDTNLWISFLISRDYSKLDKVLYSKNALLLFSQELMDEFIAVVSRPKLKKYFSAADVEKIIETIGEFAEFIKVKTKSTDCRDVKDNFLLSLAIDGHANYLLTGDKDLLVLEKIRTAKIITISQYLDKK